MFEHLRTRDDELFAQLGDACRHLARSSRLLEEVLAGPAGREGPLVDVIRDEDREAHDLAHAADVGAFRAWVMRVDRMEVHDIAAALDAAVDALDKAARMAQALHAGDAPAPLRAYANAVTRAIDVLGAGVPHTGVSHAHITDTRTELERIRDEAGERADTGIEQLFAGEAPPLDVLRWRDIYDRLRIALDCTVTAGRALDQVTQNNDR